MGLLENLEGRAEEVASKFGIAPEQVRSIVATLQAKLSGGTEPSVAAAQIADQHDVPQSKVQDILSHLGGGNLAGELGGIAKSLLG